jgi:hypothetical protein
MSQAQAVSPLILTLVAGGFTIFGVVLKIGYDSLAARRAAKNAGLERFADERRQVYERFYELVQRQLAAERALYALMEAHHKEGKTEISDDEKARVPASALAELITTLDQIRRLARLYSVITAAEAIVKLFVDMTRAMRAALDDPGPNDEITWFLLQRFLEDRISEFLHGYREDLGLGPPKGAPKTWPIVQRKHPVSLTDSEAVVRAHLRPKASTKTIPQTDQTDSSPWS